MACHLHEEYECPPEHSLLAKSGQVNHMRLLLDLVKDLPQRQGGCPQNTFTLIGSEAEMSTMLLLQHCALQTVQNIASQQNWWSERFASKAIVDRLVVIVRRSHVDGSRPLAAAALARLLHTFPSLLTHFSSAHGPACLLPGKPGVSIKI